MTNQPGNASSTAASADQQNQRNTGKRAELIRIGVAILTEKGFYNTPLDEIVKIAGVPKGSFYYYFKSKDIYTLAVIQSYSDYFIRKLDKHLFDYEQSPLNRIRSWTEDAGEGLAKYDFKRGCLVGNLGQELAALDENYRVVLRDVLDSWCKKIKDCLDEAKQAGEISPSADTEALSKFFWNAWEGAVLYTKLDKSRAALDLARDAFFSLAQARP
ncbi:TetR/AcrR family transcriptional regulator [Pseudomonas rhodesiae]|uniref:TetR/AcrR family transcriptional regulator n=1 Tax=Pseudomonas rhodesiae TaxID=76760 RepID=UPI001BD09DEA|nr:TetR/AcrR family transcriptional regulator [Pseudomonas rhodesiae]QVN04046.1 TetR/AcrR family transcriptional regulator [Pseudomonas rhodesiae]